VRCLHSAGAILPTIPPIAAHKTTGFVDHARTFLYWGINLYLRKFLVFLAKTFEGTDLFVGTDLLPYGSQNQLFYALQ